MGGLISWVCVCVGATRQRSQGTLKVLARGERRAGTSQKYLWAGLGRRSKSSTQRQKIRKKEKMKKMKEKC